MIICDGKYVFLFKLVWGTQYNKHRLNFNGNLLLFKLSYYITVKRHQFFIKICNVWMKLATLAWRKVSARNSIISFDIKSKGDTFVEIRGPHNFMNSGTTYWFKLNQHRSRVGSYVVKFILIAQIGIKTVSKLCTCCI